MENGSQICTDHADVVLEKLRRLQQRQRRSAPAQLRQHAVELVVHAGEVERVEGVVDCGSSVPVLDAFAELRREVVRAPAVLDVAGPCVADGALDEVDSAAAGGRGVGEAVAEQRRRGGSATAVGVVGVGELGGGRGAGSRQQLRQQHGPRRHGLA